MNLSTLPFTPILALSRFTEFALFSGAILVVAAILFFWAAAIRKPVSRPRYKYHRPDRETPPPPKRSRRKRRSEPPRNPTLAETRGLPPVREQRPHQDERYQY